jgi:hypothetical protein
VETQFLAKSPNKKLRVCRYGKLFMQNDQITESGNQGEKKLMKKNLIESKKIPEMKPKAIAIALFLVLTAPLMLSVLPSASAHTPAWNIPTFAFISVSPNPIGVNQPVTVFFWLDKVMPSAALTNDIRFHNYQLTITKPDGTTETKTYPAIYDPTSSQYTAYIPTQVGTYTFKFNFPGQTYDWSTLNGAALVYQNDTYLSSSASTTLIVQQQQLPSPLTSYPLPTEYWTRPINGENNDWWSISSNWLGIGSPGYGGFASPGSKQNSFPGDAIGPLTNHVMWTKPLQAGGVVGGNNFAIQGNTYFEGSAYNQRFANPIVINGKLYYTEPLSFTGAPNSAFGGTGPYGPTDCVDLRTGQVIWSRSDVPPLSFGYIYDLEDPNQHGVYPPILFTSNFARAFDSDTGIALFNVTGVPTGSAVNGPQGEQLRYVMANAGNTTNPDWRLGEWNSTKLWSFTGSSPAIVTGPVSTGTAVDGSVSNPANSSCRYDWNVTIPWRNTMTGTPTVVSAFYNNMLICYNGSLPTFNVQAPYTYFAVNLNPAKGQVGSVLWWNTVNPLPGNITMNAGGADPTVGVFVEATKETMQWVGYSMTTGQKLWGPTASQTAFDYYGNTGVANIQGCVAYGKLYSSQFGGILYCYDLPTGKILWTYGNGGPGNSTNSGFYTTYVNYPTFITAIGNGKIYTITSEHTADAPIYKGALARCIDATTGKELWTIPDYTSYLAGPSSSPVSYAIADGFATYFNGYDNQIYSVGQGPSATTVTVSPKISGQGSAVLMEGTVTDTAAGTKQNEQAARFPNGVPAVSDASMKDWMGYIYMQRPKPTNTTGVSVHLTAIDPNGNFQEMGTAFTNDLGNYAISWTPPVPGLYTVTATFEGSNAYYRSQAGTSFVVSTSSASPIVTAAPTQSAAPTSNPTTPTQTPTSPSPSAAQQPTSGMPAATYIAITAAVVIIAVVAAAVVLRRRK